MKLMRAVIGRTQHGVVVPCRSRLASVVKGGEKLDETEENLLEHRTDGTDAFDTLYIGTEKFPYREISPVTASGVM